jgi:hypothetical protein
MVGRSSTCGVACLDRHQGSARETRLSRDCDQSAEVKGLARIFLVMVLTFRPLSVAVDQSKSVHVLWNSSLNECAWVSE